MGNVSRDFEFHGGSYLISDKNYAQYIEGAESIGRPDGQFMIPANQMNELLAKHSDEPREWERQLGLEKGSLGDSNIHRVDVYNPQDYNPRLPTEDMSGANDKFIPGGKTPGGQDECVINQFPNPENNPSVGKITTIDNGISDTQNTAYNNASSGAQTSTSSARDLDLSADLGMGSAPVKNNPLDNGIQNPTGIQ